MEIPMTSLLNINVLAFAVCFSFGEFSLARTGYITGASIYPRWRRSLECAFLVKTKFSGVIIQCNRNYLLQHCEKLLEMIRKKLFESLRYNTVVNSGGKCDTLCSSRNSYLHKFLI